MKHDARIESSRPRSHAETIKRCKAERAVYTLPFLEGTHTRATAEMCDDYATISNPWSNFRQDRSYVFVRQTVKTVSLQPCLTQIARQRNELGNFRLTTMKTGVEARNLWNVGQSLHRCFDGREVVRLMKRCKRHSARNSRGFADSRLWTFKL